MAVDTDHAHGRPPGLRAEIGRWLRQTGGFTARYTRELFRSKAVLFWTLVFPAGFYLLAIRLFLPDSLPAEIVPHVRAITAVSYGTFGGLIATLNGFSEPLGNDLDEDRYLQFRALSIAPSADLAGRFLAGLALCVTAFLVVVPVALLSDASFTLQSPLSPLVVVLALLTFGLFWMAVAVVVAVVIEEGRYVSLVTVTIALVAYMLTGYNGTQPELYEGPSVLLHLLPNTLSTRLISAHLVSGTGDSIAPPAIPETGVALLVLSGIALASVLGALAVARRFLYHRSAVPWRVIR